jgi:hypothetical protein
VATVEVSGNVRTPKGVAFPEGMGAELWFRPNQDAVAPGTLIVGVEEMAELDPGTGTFTAMLEVAPDLWYKPFFRWVVDKSDPKPSNWSFGYREWPYQLWPGNGGAIEDLLKQDLFTNAWVLYGYGPPSPSILAGERPYIDLSGTKMALYGPGSAVV